MNTNFRNFAIWVVIVASMFALFNLFQSNHFLSPQRQEISYSDFLAAVDSGNVSEVEIRGQKVTGKYRDKGGDFATVNPEDPGIIDTLKKKGVKITGRSKEEDVPSVLSVVLNWFPLLLIIGIWFFFLRQMQSGGGRAMGFGKSKAKLLTERQGRVTFEDVAGVDEAKVDLQEIVEFLRDPGKFQRLGGRIPRGALLVGPPGTGKTLIARAVAGEANVPFFTISGSDFVEMFVGVGASRVRDMFDQAKKNAPCIIFIDEIDAVGRHRGAGLGGGNDEREQTLNQLLVEMDGFEANEGVIILAATNRPDVLDPALLRPGRFDRQIIVPNPDVGGREKILKVHMRKVPLAADVDAKVLARGTPGFSGADLGNLVNEAALLAARRGKRMVTQQEFEDSKEKVMMGPERRSAIRTKEEIDLVAYHEAGHAIVGIHMKECDPLHRLTIVPRGRAGGYALMLPEQDPSAVTRTVAKCTADLAMTFGGREAEILIYGPEKVTAGASGDIQQATRLARAMVMEWGMSEKLGRVRYASNEQEIFLGHSVTQSRNVSESTANLIDNEVRTLIETAEQTARRILKESEKQLRNVRDALLEYETLTGDEVRAIVRGEKINRKLEDDERGAAGPAVPVVGVKPRDEPGGLGGLTPQPQV